MRSGQKKLTPAKARAIRALWFQKPRMKQREIAAMFHVKQPLVSKVCSGYAWAGLDFEPAQGL